MDNWIPNLCILLLGFCIGGIPFGLIIGKLKGIDIRNHGSGNIGATNVLRVCGRKWGYLCFFLDALKGFLPVLLAKNWSHNYDAPLQQYTPIFAIAGVVGGHVWSPFLGLKGGKGVATSAGAIMAVAPYAALLSLGLWYTVFRVTRYVSLASIAAALGFPIIAVSFDLFVIKTPSRRLGGPVLGFLCLLSLGVILKHKDNIQRLISGTERRFDKDRNCSQ